MFTSYSCLQYLHESWRCKWHLPVQVVAATYMEESTIESPFLVRSRVSLNPGLSNENGALKTIQQGTIEVREGQQ